MPDSLAGLFEAARRGDLPVDPRAFDVAIRTERADDGSLSIRILGFAETGTGSTGVDRLRVHLAPRAVEPAGDAGVAGSLTS
jgi:hypothetical protein